MKNLFLVGPFNNWEIQQKFAFKVFEGKFHTLLVELPAGPHAFRISASDGEAASMLGADGGAGQVALDQPVQLKSDGAELVMRLDQGGIFLFNIDHSGGEESPALRVSAKFLNTVSQSGAHRAGFGLEHFLDTKLPVTIEVGKTQIALGDAMALGQGSVVELDRLAGDTVNVYVGDRLVALGEPVVINDTFGVRILEIVSPP